MLLIIFYSGIDVLFQWWHSEVVSIIFIAEIMAIITGILVGLYHPLKRMGILGLLFLEGVGLFLVVKELLYGMSNEFFMMFPFMGEIVAVGTTITLLTFTLKRIITSR